MASKIKGLQQWCQRMTAGYRDVHVKDFTTSWRDGLAFCAIVHRFRPDLIDYDSLSKENVFDNNHLAFMVAEKELDIPAFLEAADMVALKTPDKLSVITYVSQYYNKLSALPQLGGPGVQGKKTTSAVPAHGTKRHQAAEPLSEPEPKKQPPAKREASESAAKVKTLGDRCAICNNKVYLLERHVEEGKLYHRSCFRHSDLSPTNKVYTRSPFFSPSLHGKDSSAASPLKSSTALQSSNSSGTVLGSDDKHGTKRPADSTGPAETGSKSEVRKSLFSKDTDARHTPEGDKLSTKGSETGKKDVSQGKLLQSDRSVHTPKMEPHTKSKVVSSSPAGGLTSETHSSMDFLPAGKDSKDVKSAKRQLPLIFQAASPAGDGASGKKNNGALNAASVFPQNKSTNSPRSTSLSTTKQIENSADSVTSSKRSDNKSSNSAFSGISSKSMFDDKLTGKSSQPMTQPEKTQLQSGVTEKSSGPVAKPRRFGTKMADDTSAVKDGRDKSPAFPKAGPRTSVASSETSHKSVLDKPKSPSALRKALARPKSPARDLPPPPLPSSAPPSLPPSSSSAPIPQSPRHLPSPGSPKPSPRKKSVTSKSNGSSEGKSKTGLSSSKATSSHSARQEEPMEVEEAFSKARSQYGEEPVAVMVVPANKEQQENTALTGLLRSLAQVRNTNATTAASTTTTTTTSYSRIVTSGSEGKTLSTLTGPSSVPDSGSPGLVSTKVTHGFPKDGDHKLVLVDRKESKDSSSSFADGLPSDSKVKSSLSFSLLKTGGSSHKDTETQKKTLPVSKLGETVTITLNTKKSEGDASKPVFVLSKQKEHEKSLDRVPLYKKKADSNVANRTNRSGDSPREPPGKDASHKSGKTVDVKDRPKSAADVLGRRELSTPKHSAASTDTSQPLFTQVKLREAGHSTLERKERAKSAGSLSDSRTDSRPSWQQEAERKMAMYREAGFVDPETKKTVGKSAETTKSGGASASSVEDSSTGKEDKSNKRGPPLRPPPLQNLAPETNQGEGKLSRAAASEDKKKRMEVKDNTRSAGKPDSALSDSEQNAQAVAAANLGKKGEKIPFTGRLKGILKMGSKDVAETPKTAATPKPDSCLPSDDTRTPGMKVTPALVKTPQGHDTAALSKPAQVSETKKKVPVSGLKGLDDSLKSSELSSPSRTPPPSRPPPPSQMPQGRKKISVDIHFDFDSSVGSSDQPRSPATVKASPPVRPPPPHRTSMSPGQLSAIELQKQLLDIDSKLSELELRGRHLEDSIRSVAAEEEDEDLMMEWFQLVSEKNDLVRKESDLVYMSREQDLEDEQSQIESQLHYLLFKDENDKSFEEKEEEEYLIQRKVEIVNQRNSIVESIDEDRLRYEEEDRDIAQVLKEKGFKKDGSTPQAKEKGKGAQGGEVKVGSSKFYT